MKNTITSFPALVAYGIVALAASTHAASSVDPRLVLITPVQLEEGINQTAISSPKQLELLSRAQSSHLAVLAYEQYRQIQDKRPRSAQANLLAGMAAVNDWEYQTNPSTTQSPPSPQALNVLKEARLFLSQAVQLEPNSPRANMEYGYFLWQYGYDGRSANQGFSLIQKAVQLSPNDPAAHVLLGDVCSNPYSYHASHYNAIRATGEYQLATTLDPLYASPHWGLVILDSLLGRYPEAKIQMTDFLSLSPANVANEKIVRVLQTGISRGLRKG